MSVLCKYDKELKPLNCGYELVSGDIHTHVTRQNIKLPWQKEYFTLEYGHAPIDAI